MEKKINYIMLFMAFISMSWGFIYAVENQRGFIYMIAVLMLLSGGCLFIVQKKKMSFAYGILFLLLMSFFIRGAYVVYTPTWIRQHDVIGFGAGFGQAGFIEYFYEKLRLLDVDPRKYWGFFQPPLHHMTAGVYLRLAASVFGFFSKSYNQACESVQCLTLFYSMVASFFGIKLILYVLRDYDIVEEKRRRIVLVTGSFIAFHPCLILMSGSINNDILCLMLQIICVYFFVRYIRENKAWILCLSALFLGLSMMAKLSGVMLVPGIALILMYRFVRCIKSGDKAEIIKTVKNYFLFGVISVPAGIWSPVRNLVKFGLPLNYTPEVGEPLKEAIFGRIFNFKTATPFTCMVVNNDGYDEFNIPLAFIKTSLFGEYNFSECSGISFPAGVIMLILAVVLSAAVLYMMVRVVLAKTDEMVVFLSVYFVFSYVFLINLCISIPNFSSQDYRYIAHCIILQAVFAALYMADGGFHKHLKKFTGIVITAFSFVSVLLYLTVGFVKW